MAYCTYETDVRPRASKLGELRDEPTEEGGPPATTPTATEGNALIEQIAAEIDGRLRARGIAVPVTDTEGKATLLPINALGAAAAILRSAFPQDQGIGGDGGAAAGIEKQYQAWLSKIDSGLLDKDSVRDGGNVTDGFPRRRCPGGERRLPWGRS